MKRWALAAGCLLLGGLIGSYFVAPVLHGQPGKQQAAAVIPKELTSYRDLVKRVLPGVVSLDAKVKAPLPGELKPPDAPKVGFGSGVVIDPRGVILTSFHVVEGAEAVIVTFHDGRQVLASDIRGDKKTDLAIVLLDAKGMGQLPYLPLGDSNAMEIGDRVLAVGAPFGLAGSVTHGIISGKGRNGLKLNMYEDFLQTDAAINPGNSGGPLVNLEGQVIGINAAIKSKSGGFQGVGLAVASNLAKSVTKALLIDGVVKRGYLGCFVRELSPELAGTLGVGKQGGVIVAEVYANSPAAKAGLQPGDVITTFAGQAVPDTTTLQNIVIGLPLNKSANLTIYRDGRPQTLKVTIVEQPSDLGVQTPPK